MYYYILKIIGFDLTFIFNVFNNITLGAASFLKKQKAE
jgi:hypothetical protein